jgi:Skp family chaperone for outer membrane proteins
MLENDPDRPLKEKQYLLQLNAMKFNRQWAVQEAEREYVRALERLHSAMKALVAAYAKENGIEVVMLSTESDGPMHAETRQDFDLRSRLRGVVYAAPTVDITDAIIARIPENERIK